ncbi:MAG: rod-binding protein, partial [Treponema sp.]|nr:rod-binding protein [Treponema sp.]
MEVTNPTTAYFDNYRTSVSSNSLAGVVNGPAVNGSQNFASILEKMAFDKTAFDKTNASENNLSENTSKTKIDKNDRLYQLCLELETFLVKNLITGMRNTVQKSGLIDQGFAGKMYEDMLYDEYAKDFTKNANFGLAEQA